MPHFNIYDDNGWLDIPRIVERNPINYCWIYVIDVRGGGKTFGALSYACRRADEGKGAFIYMRRTQEQCDLISRNEFSPINALNKIHGWDLIMSPVTKKNSAIYHSEVDKDGKTILKGPYLGITAGLSTFRNLRGLSLEDVTLLIYDEFVPERHERGLKSEGYALLQAYETINRNRELAGKPPLICLCLGNADDLGNNVFMDLGWTDRAEWMVKNNKEVYLDRERRTAIYIPHSSPVAAGKAETALYKMAGQSRFTDMAIKNRFAQEGITTIISRPIKEYTPLVSIPYLCIYKHKDRREYYATEHIQGSPDAYQDDDIDMDRFRRKYIYLWDAYMREDIKFETYSCMRRFEEAFTG